MSASVLDLDSEEEQRANRLHEETIVIDGLLPGFEYLEDPEYKDHLAQGGIDAANFTVATQNYFDETTERIQRAHSLMEENPDKRIIETTEDIHSAKENEETGVIIGFQDSVPIQRNLEYIQAFHQMGVRIIQLTYNSQNYVATGCWEREDPGLSHFGRDVIDEMNEHGILIDLSHTNDTSSMEAIEYSDDPVSFTHVAVRSIGHSYGRGKSDELMEAVAENGGVIGITFHPPYVKKNPDTHEVLPATIHDVLDHIDHVVELVGVDHVGFGSDMMDRTYDSPKEESWLDNVSERFLEKRAENQHVFGSTDPREYEPVEGLHRTTKFSNLTKGLIARGYSDEEVRKIMGKNFLRLFEEVWS